MVARTCPGLPDEWHLDFHKRLAESGIGFRRRCGSAGGWSSSLPHPGPSDAPPLQPTPDPSGRGPPPPVPPGRRPGGTPAGGCRPAGEDARTRGTKSLWLPVGEGVHLPHQSQDPDIVLSRSHAVVCENLSAIRVVDRRVPSPGAKGATERHRPMTVVGFGKGSPCVPGNGIDGQESGFEPGGFRFSPALSRPCVLDRKLVEAVSGADLRRIAEQPANSASWLHLLTAIRTYTLPPIALRDVPDVAA